jgi:hypothetical protein
LLLDFRIPGTLTRMKKRPDGRLVGTLPAYRRVVPFLMRGRNESVVFFEQVIDLSKTLPWLEAHNRSAEQPLNVFHVTLAALARVLHERPRLNRFVSGRRIYQRDGVWLSFAAKRSMSDDAPLSVIKRQFRPDEDLEEMASSLSSGIEDVRHGHQSQADKEMIWALKLPDMAIDLGIRALWALDRHNLAPRSLLAGDPMYCSAFVANLGSLKMDAAYHHLYEHGNCPLFVTIGAVDERPVAVDGEVVARPTLQIRYSYDERIEDGLYCARALRLVEGWISDPAALVESA